MEDMAMGNRAGLIEGRLVVPIDGIIASQIAARRRATLDQLDYAEQVVLARQDFGGRQARERKPVGIVRERLNEFGIDAHASNGEG